MSHCHLHQVWHWVWICHCATMHLGRPIKPKVPIFRCPKMGLQAPESKNGNHFFTPTSSHNGGKKHLVYAFITFGWLTSQFWKFQHFRPFRAVFFEHGPPNPGTFLEGWKLFLGKSIPKDSKRCNHRVDFWFYSPTLLWVYTNISISSPNEWDQHPRGWW